MVDHATKQPDEREPSFSDLGEKRTEAALEQYKARLAVWTAQETAFYPAMASHLAGVAQSGLRSLYLVNGGSLVAILALLGNIWARPGSDDVAARLEPAAKELVLGLMLAFIATAVGYLSQLCFVDFRTTRWGFRCGRIGQVVCLLVCAGSLTFFCWGVLSGIAAVGKRPPSAHAAVRSTIQQADR